jgi:hypothetical protein
MVQFHSIRVQHVVAVGDITAVHQLAGSAWVSTAWAHSAFEMRSLIDHFRFPTWRSSPWRGARAHRGAGSGRGGRDHRVDPRQPGGGAARLPDVSTRRRRADIPRRTGTSETHPVTRATWWRQHPRGGALPLIAASPTSRADRRWLASAPRWRCGRAYEQVVDTYTPNGLPTDAQLAAYLELPQATAGAPWARARADGISRSRGAWPPSWACPASREWGGTRLTSVWARRTLGGRLC